MFVIEMGTYFNLPRVINRTMSAMGGATTALVCSGMLDAMPMLQYEGDRQIKVIYESAVRDGQELCIGDLFGDLVVELVSPNVTRVAVLLNEFVLLNLPVEYFKMHDTSQVRLSSFISKMAETRFGGLYHQFFHGNVLKLVVEGRDLPEVGAACMHLEHYICDHPIRQSLDRIKPTGLVVLAPVTYNLLGAEFASRNEAGEMVTVMYFPKPLVTGIVHAIHLNRSGLSGVVLVRVKLNTMVSTAAAPGAITLTQKDQDSPVWTIPMGFRNKLGDMTHGINGSRVDTFEIEIVWDVERANDKPLNITLSQYTPWMPVESDGPSIFGSIGKELPTPALGSLVPIMLHGGSNLSIPPDSLPISNTVKIHQKKQDWAQLRTLCDRISWLTSYPYRPGKSHNSEGMWSGDYGVDGMPIPIPGDKEVDADFITKVLEIQSEAEVTEYLGISMCKICGKSTKMNVYHSLLGDGKIWEWPELLTHYYTEHQVQPSREFVNAIFLY